MEQVEHRYVEELTRDGTLRCFQDSAPILHKGSRMSDTTSCIKVIELDILDRRGGRALMVHLPSLGGRARVAFVPVKGMTAALVDAERDRFLEELLLT